jgi:hypothetical protein
MLVFNIAENNILLIVKCRDHYLWVYFVILAKFVLCINCFNFRYVSYIAKFLTY